MDDDVPPGLSKTARDGGADPSCSAGYEHCWPGIIHRQRP